MKLTSYDRETFVKAVMADVPMTNYNEVARKLATEELLQSLPDKVREVLSDKELSQHFGHSEVCVPGFIIHLKGGSMFKPSEALKSECQKLSEESRLAYRKREAMRSSVKALIESCVTLKQAKERLPEFLKYLPAERAKSITPNLPVANVVDELTKAGWPK